MLISGSGTLGATAGALTVSGGTLDLGASSQTVAAVTLSGGTIQNGTLTSSASYSCAGGAEASTAVFAGSKVLTQTVGAYTTTLSGVNTFTGGTTLSGGAGSVLVVGNNSACGTGTINFNTAPTTIQASGTGSTITFNNALTLGASPGSGASISGINEIFGAPNTANLTFTGNANSGGSTSKIIEANGITVTFGGVLSSGSSGTYTLGWAGINGGVIVLSGLNTYSKVNLLASGTVQVASAETAGTKGPLGAYTTAGAIVFGGGTLQYSGANQYDYSPRFSTSANQVYNIDVNGHAVTFATALTSSGGTLTLANSTGTGTLTLSGANTYGGGTTVNSGTLLVNNASALGYGATTVASGATLDLSGTTGVNSALTLNGTGVGANGALINSSGTPATLSNGSGVAGVTVTAAGSGISSASPPTVSFGSGSATAVPLLGVTAASFGTVTPGTQTYTVAPTVAISGGGGSIANTIGTGGKGSTGGATATANLNGSGSVTSITVTSPGIGFGATTPTISFIGGTVLASGTAPTATGNTLSYCVSGVAITASGSGYSSAPSVTISSGGATATAQLASVNLAASSSIGGAGNITINSIVGDGGSGYALTKVGAGTAILAAANTYGGGTTISAGTLEVSGSVAGNVTVSSTSGTALRLDNHTALASGATLTLPNSPAAGAVNLNFSSGQQSIAGLTIGTTSMAQGTWGSTSSSAAHTSTAFTGNGLLNVTSGGATPSIAITSISPNPVCSGSTVSLTATVSGGNSPSGTVQFFSGVTSLGTQPLLSGTATLTGVSLPAGMYANITAQYSGDNYNNSATSAAASPSLVVNALPTTSAISGSGSVAINQLGGVYSVTPTSGSSYAWTVPIGASITAGSTGPNNNHITVNFGSTGGNITVTETTSGGCVGAPVVLGVAVTANHAPVAPAAKSLTIAKNTAATYNNAKLLVGATDVDGDTLTVSAASTTTPGATVLLEANDVKYTPPTDFTGSDSYTYTISDGNGGTAIGTVNVTVTDNNGLSPNVVSYSYDSGSGTFSVTFAGIPDYEYTVEYAEGSATPPWTKLANVTAGSDGLFTVTDGPGQFGSRYYRTVYPSY